MARWLALVWLPESSDKLTADEHARRLYGGDVLMVQGFASWKEGVGEHEASERAKRNNWQADAGDENDDVQ